MLRIYITRHGQDEDDANGILNGRRDAPLTDRGIAQAEKTASNIKELGLVFDAIYTSPLSRAEKTANIIAEAIGGPAPEIFAELIEREFGVMTGLLISQIEEKCSPQILKTATITYFLDPKGAETFEDLSARARHLLGELRYRHKDGNILLVTHGDIGKMIYAAYYHLGWRDTLEMFHFGNTDLLLLAEDSPATEAHVFKAKQHNL
ncbi:MAG: histidine phosphatase family protein [Patescibacteria group bacterium]